MKEKLESLLQGTWQEQLTRPRLEIFCAVIIGLCAMGLFLGRIPTQGTVRLDGGKMVYKGRLLQDKMNGQGKLTFENGDVYEGEFKNGLFDGQGTFKAASGWIYVGQFKKGQADGQGKLTTENKTVYEGTFKQGIYQHAD